MNFQRYKPIWFLVFFVVFTVSILISNLINPTDPQSKLQPFHNPASENPAIQRKQNSNPKPYDKPKEASDFYLEKRLDGKTNAIPYHWYQNALDKMQYLGQYNTKTDRQLPSRAQLAANPVSALVNSEISEWETVGPGNIGGRTRSILIHPSDSNIMYIAGVAGGVWKSTDAGTTWTPMTDLMANIAVTTMAFKSDDPNTIYAGTGEGFFNADAVRGNGIFVSSDAGVTWTQLAATADNSDFYYVNKIIASPINTDTLYAATRTGVHRSTDGGSSWSSVYSPGGTSVGCTDLVSRSDQTPEVLLTSCGSFSPGHIARSVDGGSSWSSVLSESSMGRSSLAISPSEQNVVYALNATNQSTSNNMGTLGLNKVYRSDDGGATWATQFDVNSNSSGSGSTVVATGGGFGISLLSNTYFAMIKTCSASSSASQYNQGWYDMAISVDPLNSDTIWAGGIDIFRSDDAGANWGLTSFWWFNPSNSLYAHADQHIQVFDPQFNGTTNTTFYVGNDGGIQKSTNARANTISLTEYCNYLSTGTLPAGIVNWSSLNNGYGVTQFYDGTPFPNNTSYVGGTQDNGTILGSDADGINGWREIRGGDGGYVAVDPNNTDIMFSSYVNLSLQKSTDGGSSWSNATNGITGGGFPFITTYIMDQSDPNRLWILGNAIWRTDDQAANWTQASTNIGGSAYGTAVAVATTNSDHVLVGTSDGQILRNTSAGSATSATTWSAVQVVTSGRISGVAFDPTDENIAYATSSTFNRDHVFKSTDGGASWIAIDNRDGVNGIPNIPAHSVVIDPTNTARVFVGTDLGLFVTKDGGATWLIENSGFANTVTETLKINNGKLWAFTHGRGVYRADLLNVYAIDNASYSADEDTSLTITAAQMMDVLTNDSGADAITIASVPSNGTLSHGGGNLSANDSISLASLGDITFTPAADFNGNNSFTWYGTLSGDQQTTISTATLTINPVNDAPTASDFSLSLDEDVATNVSVSYNDVDGDSLTLNIQSAPSKGVLSGTIDNLVYTPNANENGADSFTFTVSDATTESNVATATITINPVNDAPVIADLTLNIDEDSSGVLSGFASDVDGDTLTLTITSAPSKGITEGDFDQITYTPTANLNGADSFTYTVSDGSLTSAEGTATVNIAAINDAPEASAQTLIVDEDTVLDISGLASDIDGDSLELTVTISPQNGALSGDLSSLQYTPSANFNGTDSFTFKVSDGALESETALVNITVDPINDAPVTSDASLTINEDESVVISGVATDIDGDSLTIAVVDSPSNGTLSGGIDEWTYTPNADISGSDSIRFSVSDGSLSSNRSTISITINPVNDAPVVTNQSVTLNEDSSVAITNLGSDVDSSDLTLSIVSQPFKGTVSGDIDGLTFVGGADEFGDDAFTYQVSDGDVTSEIATISLTLTPINDAPTVDDVFTVPNATVGTAFNYQVSTIFNDVDGDSLTYTATGLGSGLSMSANGSISGTPTSEGTLNVSVTASDGTESVSTSFSLIINPKPKSDSGGSMGVWILLMLTIVMLIRMRKQLEQSKIL